MQISPILQPAVKMEFVSSRRCKHSEAMVIWFVDYVIPRSPALLLLCYYWTNQVWGLSVSSKRPVLKSDRIGGWGNGAVKTSGMRDVLPHTPNIPYANPVWLLYMSLSCGFISQFCLEPGLHTNSHLHSTRPSPFLWCQSLEFFFCPGRCHPIAALPPETCHLTSKELVFPSGKDDWQSLLFSGAASFSSRNCSWDLAEESWTKQIRLLSSVLWGPQRKDGSVVVKGQQGEVTVWGQTPINSPLDIAIPQNESKFHLHNLQPAN